MASGRPAAAQDKPAPWGQSQPVDVSAEAAATAATAVVTAVTSFLISSEADETFCPAAPSEGRWQNLQILSSLNNFQPPNFLLFLGGCSLKAAGSSVKAVGCSLEAAGSSVEAVGSSLVAVGNAVEAVGSSLEAVGYVIEAAPLMMFQKTVPCRRLLTCMKAIERLILGDCS